MRSLIGALLVGAAIVLAVGCGGKSNDATGTPVVATDTIAAETTPPSTDTSTTDMTSTDATTTDTVMTDTGTTAIGLTAGCQKVADLSVQFGKALSAAGASGSTDLEKTAKDTCRSRRRCRMRFANPSRLWRRPTRSTPSH